MAPLSEQEIAEYQRAVAAAGGGEAVMGLLLRVRDELDDDNITMTPDEMYAVAALVVLSAYGAPVRQQ